MSHTISRSWWTSGLVEYQRRVDLRSVRIKQTANGLEVYKIVNALCQKRISVLNKPLHRLERFWIDQVVYRL